MWRTRTDRPGAGPDSEGGYTLIELTVVMAVFMTFMAFALPFMFTQLRQAARTTNALTLTQDGQLAFRQLTRELRQASDITNGTSKPTTSSSVSFDVDLDGNGVVNSWTDESRPLEQVTYYLSGTTLYRGRSSTTGEPVAGNVTALTILMFGSNLALDSNADGVVSATELNTNGDLDTQGNPIWQDGELLQVTRLRVEMTLGNASDTRTFQGDVWLRNQAAG